MKMLTLVVSLWICTSLSAFGADFKIITGKISNFSGEPLVGATLIVKSEDINLGGIASGLDGKYIIKVSGKTDQPLTLKVTSIGYEEKTAQILPTSDSSTVNFILNEKPIEYGTIVVSPKPRKTELMTTLSSEQINLASQRSLVGTNPISAIRQPQVIREGSNQSSKIRINGTSPVYYLNGIEMGYDPNHYGMFSIVPGSVVNQIRFSPQGASAASGSPSIIDFGTMQPFGTKFHSEMDLSFIEGTGSLSMGTSRFYLVSTVRKSVLDKIADKINQDTKQRTIPPTDFRDIFISAGLKVSSHIRLLMDHYDVTDYLSYNLGATSSNPGGINTLQNTGEQYDGLRFEGLYKHLSFKFSGARKESRERYRAISVGGDSLAAFLVDLNAAGHTNLANGELNLLFGGTRITAGGELKYVQGQEIRLRQNNWNFLAPDANSDVPFIYQRELNQYYGSYYSRGNRLDNAGYLSVKNTLGPLEVESGLRSEYFGELGTKTAHLWRASILYKSSGLGNWGISAGTYANSPVNRILESYQVLVLSNLPKLRPVETGLAAISWASGPLKIGAFKKSISYLPRVMPNFSQINQNGIPENTFLTMRSDGQINSYGADITLELDKLGRFDLYSYYGYSHADKVTRDISVPYELNATHKFFTQAGYKLTHHVNVGASISLHSGFPYTQVSSLSGVQTTNRYTDLYYRQAISTENSVKFPLNITSNLYANYDFGKCQIYAALSNISNYRNPIIRTVDGFIYDAGILPSIGLKYKL